MAETKQNTPASPTVKAPQKAPYQLTWRDKVEKGLPLNDFDRVKRDAEILTLRRIRDNQEDQQLRDEKAQIDSIKANKVSLKEVDEPLVPSAAQTETEV